jgi:hypothetical protein
MATNTVVASTIRILNAPVEQPGTPATLVYRLNKPFAVVQFETSGKGRIVFLPEGARLCVVGSSCVAGCLEVEHEERFYNIFEIDLLGPSSTSMTRGRIQPFRVFAVAAGG